MAQILIVDDDQDFAGAVRMMLQGRGYDVDMEYETANIVQRLRQLLPDVLVLDVMFPDNPLAGIELARQVRNEFPQLPIIMVTGINQAMPLGFSRKDLDPALLPVTEFLEKPIDFAALSDMLDRLLHRPTISTQGAG